MGVSWESILQIIPILLVLTLMALLIWKYTNSFIMEVLLSSLAALSSTYQTLTILTIFESMHLGIGFTNQLLADTFFFHSKQCLNKSYCSYFFLYTFGFSLTPFFFNIFSKLVRYFLKMSLWVSGITLTYRIWDLTFNYTMIRPKY